MLLIFSVFFWFRSGFWSRLICFLDNLILSLSAPALPWFLDFHLFFLCSNFPLITKSYFSYSLTFPRQCVCLRRVSFWFPTNHPIPFSSLFDFSPLRVFSHVSSNHLVSCEIKTNSWFLLLLFKFPPRRLFFNFPLITQSSFLPLSCTSWFSFFSSRFPLLLLWFPPLFFFNFPTNHPIIILFLSTAPPSHIFHLFTILSQSHRTHHTLQKGAV